MLNDFQDGILLQESEKISINNTSDGACRLRIYAFSQSDIGLYTCIATNALGSADTCANLNIQGLLNFCFSMKKLFPIKNQKLPILKCIDNIVFWQI